MPSKEGAYGVEVKRPEIGGGFWHEVQDLQHPTMNFCVIAGVSFRKNGDQARSIAELMK